MQAGPIVPGEPKKLSDDARVSLYRSYNTGEKRVYYPVERNAPPNAYRLTPYATFYKYALLDGRRITPISQSHRLTVGSSIVKVNCSGVDYAGEVLNIFHHSQPGTSLDENAVLLAEIRWMEEVDLSPTSDDPWSDLYVL